MSTVQSFSIVYIFSLLGGLALFLYGMDLMSEGLELFAGNKLQKIIEKLTSNTLKGIGVGIAVTAIIQSSSATTVMVVGFVNAGLMSLQQAVGVIMGANIGTTVTGQLVALNITDSAPLIAFIGFFMYKFINKSSISHLGQVVMGLGVLFMGMDIMSQSMVPLQTNEAFVSLMTKISNPITGIFVGTFFTAIIQSSSASLGILQALANKGLVGLHGSMYIIFGFNIGTCITSILSAMGSSKNGKRAAAVHVLFNVIGTIIFVILLGILPIETWVVKFSKDLPAAQLANFHTLFNIVATVILFPFSKYLANLATKLIPGKDPLTEDLALKYINIKSGKDSNAALTDVRAETTRMLDIARENYKIAMEIFNDYDEKKHRLLLHNEEIINYLNSNITKYIIDVLSEPMDDTMASYFTGYLRIVRDIERIGDHTKSIGEYAKASYDRNLYYSEDFHKEIRILDQRLNSLYKSIYEDKTREERRANTRRINDIVEVEIETFRNRHIDRMKNGTCDPESGLFYEKLLSSYERISAYLSNIGKLVI
ncbi:Na/Pi cotransporter family protein [Anaerosphaera multitolerans]|uniref:Na/Pi cotransporter family protein n=1 Tax=Anaerosphaera multitolerans TaxID=2487351 RepID=A0A437S5H0_9FIRM|nr:Na/Pi cotransporter family protein [Anaerosphaera multitolerans]RVU54217.1 Na/Pi cotransporter family protein [Anaerosphaera multitolerans]